MKFPVTRGFFFKKKSAVNFCGAFRLHGRPRLAVNNFVRLQNCCPPTADQYLQSHIMSKQWNTIIIQKQSFTRGRNWTIWPKKTNRWTYRERRRYIFLQRRRFATQFLLRQPLTGITLNPNEQVEEVEEAPAAEMSVVDSLKEVLKKALIFDGLRRGLHE